MPRETRNERLTVLSFIPRSTFPIPHFSYSHSAFTLSVSPAEYSN